MEDNRKKCRGPCGQIKLRIQDGYWNKKDKRYIDESKKAWNGMWCNSCHKERVKMHTKVKRSLNE